MQRTSQSFNPARQPLGLRDTRQPLWGYPVYFYFYPVFFLVISSQREGEEARNLAHTCPHTYMVDVVLLYSFTCFSSNSFLPFGGICAHFTVYFYSNKRILKGWWQCFSLLVYSFITLCHSQPFSFIFTMFAILRLCISCMKCFVVDAVACVFACALTSAVRGLLPVVVWRQINK